MLFDADPQGSLSISLGIKRPDELDISLATVMGNVIDNKPFDDNFGIVHCSEDIDLMPCNVELSGIESYLFIAALTALSLFCFFGCAATTVKGIIFCLLLAFSSYEDIKTRECENYVHLMIVIAAFIGTEMSALLGMLLSALITGGIMLATAAVTKSSIGGADIKLSAVCAFILGTVQGMTGLMIGLILAVIINSIKNRKKKNEGFPLIPYLAVGFTAAYFM